MKIAILIPCTSKKRKWNTIKESYLYNLSLKTLLLTQSKEHTYVFYIGHDKNDRIFDNKKNQKEITKFNSVFKNVSFQFICFKDIKPGHLTKMWNVLFKKAYDEKCEYFFQCGDDIVFHTKDWINDCIKKLEENNNIGLTGPINNNNRILTQSFVSRKHMEIFGWFFPEEIINWGCDDWYNMVYHPTWLYPLSNHFCSNDGGEPRYLIDNDQTFFMQPQLKTNGIRAKAQKLANKHKKNITEYIKNNNIV